MCYVLQRLFDNHPDMVKLRDQNFVTVPVNFSSENKNEECCHTIPRSTAFPIFTFSIKTVHYYMHKTVGSLITIVPTR